MATEVTPGGPPIVAKTLAETYRIERERQQQQASSRITSGSTSSATTTQKRYVYDPSVNYGQGGYIEQRLISGSWRSVGVTAERPPDAPEYYAIQQMSEGKPVGEATVYQRSSSGDSTVIGTIPALQKGETVETVNLSDQGATVYIKRQTSGTEVMTPQGGMTLTPEAYAAFEKRQRQQEVAEQLSQADLEIQQKKVQQMQAAETALQKQMEKVYTQATVPEVIGMHTHTLFSEKGLDYLWSYLPGGTTPESVVQKKMIEAYKADSTLNYVGGTMVGSLVGSPTGILGTSMLGGVGASAIFKVGGAAAVAKVPVLAKVGSVAAAHSKALTVGILGASAAYETSEATKMYNELKAKNLTDAEIYEKMGSRFSGDVLSIIGFGYGFSRGMKVQPKAEEWTVTKATSIGKITGKEGSKYVSGYEYVKLEAMKKLSTFQRFEKALGIGVKPKTRTFDAIITAGTHAKEGGEVSTGLGKILLVSEKGKATERIYSFGSKVYASSQQIGVTGKGVSTYYTQGQRISFDLSKAKGGNLVLQQSGVGASKSKIVHIDLYETPEAAYGAYARQDVGISVNKQGIDVLFGKGTGRSTFLKTQTPIKYIQGSGGSTPFVDYTQTVHPLIQDLSGITKTAGVSAAKTAAISSGLSYGEGAAKDLAALTLGRAAASSASKAAPIITGIGLGTLSRLTMTQPAETPVLTPSGGTIIFGKGVAYPSLFPEFPKGTDTWVQLGRESIRMTTMKESNLKQGGLTLVDDLTNTASKPKVASLFGESGLIIKSADQKSSPRVADVYNLFMPEVPKVHTETLQFQTITPRLRQQLSLRTGRLARPAQATEKRTTGRYRYNDLLGPIGTIPLFPTSNIYARQPRRRASRRGLLYWEKINPVWDIRKLMQVSSKKNARGILL